MSSIISNRAALNSNIAGTVGNNRMDEDLQSITLQMFQKKYSSSSSKHYSDMPKLDLSDELTTRLRGCSIGHGKGYLSLIDAFQSQNCLGLLNENNAAVLEVKGINGLIFKDILLKHDSQVAFSVPAAILPGCKVGDKIIISREDKSNIRYAVNLETEKLPEKELFVLLVNCSEGKVNLISPQMKPDLNYSSLCSDISKGWDWDRNFIHIENALKAKDYKSLREACRILAIYHDGYEKYKSKVGCLARKLFEAALNNDDCNSLRLAPLILDEFEEALFPNYTGLDNTGFQDCLLKIMKKAYMIGDCYSLKIILHLLIGGGIYPQKIRGQALCAIGRFITPPELGGLDVEKKLLDEAISALFFVKNVVYAAKKNNDYGSLDLAKEFMTSCRGFSEEEIEEVNEKIKILSMK